MRNRIQAASAALLGALVLAFATSGASARNLSYSSQTYRILWASLRFSESGGNFPITCPVTLEGSFHSRTFAKVRDLLAGYITRAVVNNAGCTEGQATILAESLPWHVTYQSFTGSLPSINSVRYNLIGAAFQIEPTFGIVCLARTTTTFPAAGDAARDARGNITSLIPDSELAIPVTGTNCPRAGIFSGGGEVFVLGSTSQRVTLSLI
jgi:hypothetical protein